MADDRQPEDGASQWDPAGGPEPSGTHGANGFSSSSYRSCQSAGSHPPSVPFSGRENGFNGELTGAHAVTAEQVSARIVQEVTAEAVAVLKGEQESQRLPSVEDTTNLPPSPPPSPAAEHVAPLDQDDEKSMATEQMESLPEGRVQQTAVQTQQTEQKRTEKPVKPRAKAGRVKGRIATPERKPLRKEPVYTSREEAKKKKAVAKKSELAKKAESPSKRSGPKPAIRQTRPTQHHSVPRRRLAGDPVSPTVNRIMSAIFSPGTWKLVGLFNKTLPPS